MGSLVFTVVWLVLNFVIVTGYFVPFLFIFNLSGVGFVHVWNKVINEFASSPLPLPFSLRRFSTVTGI